MANPENKDENQNAIRPETDWPSPIYHHRRWPLKYKKAINTVGVYTGYFIGLIIIIGCIYLLYDIIRIYFDTDNKKQFAELRNSLFILAALIGAPFLVWRTMIASKQANTAQEKAYTELFTQAVEQLGSVKPTGKDQYEVNIEVRIGALYALERIMHDSDKDAKFVIDTLATYVRHNCGDPKSFDFKMPEEKEFKVFSEWVDAIKNTVEEIKTKAETFKKDAPATRHDIRTALTIIGRRPAKYKTKDTKPDLYAVNFQGADLQELDLSSCNLSRAHMQGAEMYQLNLQNAELFEADMSGANMSGANLQKTIMGRSVLRGIDMQHADLEGADMREADLQGTDMQYARMQDVEMTNAKLQCADLWNAQMQRINLRRANLQNAFLQEAEMQGAHLSGAQLQGADMQKANLQGAHLRGINVEGANLQVANLRDADMSEEEMLMVMELGAIT